MTAEEERKWTGLRAKTLQDLRKTWKSLSKNRVWKSLLRRRRPQNAVGHRNLFEMWFDFFEHEVSQIWIDDILTVLVNLYIFFDPIYTFVSLCNVWLEINIMLMMLLKRHLPFWNP